MSPARIARRKVRRLTLMGMAVELAYVAALGVFCCLLIALSFAALG